MSAMMGGEAGSQEDMFAKLENMRAVITEVNTQFKDPVGRHIARWSSVNDSQGKNYICLCLHFGISVSI
jgi:hypothetical protein